MCTNTNSENSRSLTASAPRKLRVNGDPNSGNRSSHSALATALAGGELIAHGGRPYDERAFTRWLETTPVEPGDQGPLTGG